MKEYTEGNVAIFILWFITALGVPSILLYIVILIVLIKYRSQDNFNSGFFSLFISTGIGDISQFFLRLLWSKLPRLSETLSEFATTNKLFALVCVGGTVVMYQVQVVGMVFTALNRLLTFMSLFGGIEYWTKRMTVFTIAVQWVWALVYSFGPVVYYYKEFDIGLNYNTTYFLHFWTTDEVAKFGFVTGVFLDVFFNSWAVIIMYSVAGVVLRKKKKNNLSAAQCRQWNTELRLGITGALVASLFIVMDMSAIVEAFDLPGRHVAWTLMFVALDLFTYINPWLLVLFSKEVRHHCLLLLGLDLNRVQTIS